MNWSQALLSLEGFVVEQEIDTTWANAATLRTLVDDLASRMDEDRKALSGDLAYLFEKEIQAGHYKQHTVSLFRKWHLQDKPPSLAALASVAIELFQLEKQEVIVRAMLVAAILGEVESSLPYHSNMHFRKVLIQTIGLIVTHNQVFTGTSHILTHQEIGLMLIGAIIHDLGHDGKNNSVEGVHCMGRMEKRSFDLALPFMKKIGIDQDGIAGLSVMLLTTDVSPIDGDNGANMQLKRAYRYNQGQEETLGLHEDLKILESNPRLTMMCMLLHEADIATSAGLSYDVTKFETSLFAVEIGKDCAKPHMVIDFLEKVCQRKMFSDAAQKLFAANMARIYILAEEDMDSGDHPYPAPEHANFMLGIDSNDENRDSRTLN